MHGDRPTLRTRGVADGAAGAPATLAADGVEASSEQQLAQHSWTEWRNLWQVPTIVLSIALIVLGIRSATRPATAQDFDGALAQVEQFIAAGQIEQAYAQLRDAIEIHLDEATLSQRARFHAASADLTFASQQISGLASDDSSRHIAEQYARAKDFGFDFDAVHHERWGEVLLELGDLDGVERQLRRLRTLALAAQSASSRAASVTLQNVPAASAKPDDDVSAPKAYARLFRRAIETRLNRSDLDAARVLKMLADYRESTAMDAGERLWVAARLCELRLATGETDAAVNGLLVEMRRLESDSIAGERVGEVDGIGELYLLLGRGYHELGQAARAQEQLERALELLRPSQAACGEAHTLLGRIAMAAGDYETACEKFITVIDGFVGTRSYLPALLSKAECDSLMGEHDAALEGFREVAARLKRDSARRDLPVHSIAARLCDRHDAAMDAGQVQQALEYAAIAETMFAADLVPGPVLIRLASGNRQRAEELLASGVSADPTVAGPASLEPEAVDPAVRSEANRRFVAAAEDYLRHARAESAEPSSEDDRAFSLWNAADCFDRGGRHRQAIAQFTRYMGDRPSDDPRVAEAIFRIAQSRQALMEYAEAARGYEQVLWDRANSSVAARCFVPLARCYLALNRADDARRTLEEVVSGQRLLSPEAVDFRDALAELGRLHHAQGDFVSAIERLTEALDRYPGDGRRDEWRSLLAESYRANAAQIARRLEQDAAMTAVEHERLTALRTEHLQRAERIFGAIVADYALKSNHAAPPATHDLVRRAHLYQADCAFELAQFNRAAEIYESASREYGGEASSMYALVQTVNSYAALGDSQRAAAAHQRALLQLKQLPDSAFASADALMDSAAWERWLRNSPLGGAAPQAGERVAGAPNTGDSE